MRGGSIRSERLFCEQFEYNLLFRWFLDMDKVSPAFDRSVCSVIRFRAFLTGAAPNLPRLARLPPPLDRGARRAGRPDGPRYPSRDRPFRRRNHPQPVSLREIAPESRFFNSLLVFEG